MDLLILYICNKTTNNRHNILKVYITNIKVCFIVPPHMISSDGVVYHALQLHHMIYSHSYNFLENKERFADRLGDNVFEF